MKSISQLLDIANKYNQELPPTLCARPHAVPLLISGLCGA